MKRFIDCICAATLVSLVFSQPGYAQLPQIHRLTPAQIQRLSRDLIPPGPQDFFEQGRRYLEREAQDLTQQRFLQGDLLKISQDQKIQPDFSQFERPDLLQPNIKPNQ